MGHDLNEFKSEDPSIQKQISDEDIKFFQDKWNSAKSEVRKRVTGLDFPTELVILTALSRGHVLLEGMPGLAKTLLAKSISEILDTPFQRVQFTPDLLPADLTGTNVFNPKTTEFDIRKGPIFTGVLLADEINRAPAKVQSALLQCMEERSVSIGDKTFQLDPDFFVLATQNPIDQEGTYQLPEAQMDRFFVKIHVSYPSLEEELGILNQHGISQSAPKIKPVYSAKDRQKIYKIIDSIYVDERLKLYLLKLIRNSRPETSESKDAQTFIRVGASPRASLALLRLAKAKALQENRRYVIPEDIQYYSKEVFRHRILLKYEAIAEEISVETMIEAILDQTEVP
jgi:MoxR-like ATPase